MGYEIFYKNEGVDKKKNSVKRDGCLIFYGFNYETDMAIL